MNPAPPFRHRLAYGLVGFLSTLALGAFAIVDGKPVAADAYPWVFFLQNSARVQGVDYDPWDCTAILAAPRLLITNAHCVEKDVVTLRPHAYNGSNTGKRATRGDRVELDHANGNPRYVHPFRGMTEDQFLYSAEQDIGYIVLKSDAVHAPTPEASPTPIPLAPIQLMDNVEDLRALAFAKLRFVGYGPDFDTDDGVAGIQHSGVKRFGDKVPSAMRATALTFQGSDQAPVPGDSGGPLISYATGTPRVIGLASQFRRDAGGGYEEHAVHLLRQDTLCWVVKDSGIPIPGVGCL